jgi:ABC-type multidrug transport system fused ATPase/permease subunit
MFPDSTIIAIAHRLRTIMDYDRVLVMAEGEIIEYVLPTFFLVYQCVRLERLTLEEMIHPRI